MEEVRITHTDLTTGVFASTDGLKLNGPGAKSPEFWS
jgi:hypothetical protein